MTCSKYLPPPLFKSLPHPLDLKNNGFYIILYNLPFCTYSYLHPSENCNYFSRVLSHLKQHLDRILVTFYPIRFNVSMDEGLCSKRQFSILKKCFQFVFECKCCTQLKKNCEDPMCLKFPLTETKVNHFSFIN